MKQMSHRATKMICEQQIEVLVMKQEGNISRGGAAAQGGSDSEFRGERRALTAELAQRLQAQSPQPAQHTSDPAIHRAPVLLVQIHPGLEPAPPGGPPQA